MKWKPFEAVVLGIICCISLTGLAAQPASQPQSASGGQNFCCVDATKLNFPTKLMLESLQALANSNTPVLFVIQRPQDVSWRQAMEKLFG